jgi:hypothetical protein
MEPLLRRCAEYGLLVRFADLGQWGDAELRSEYDPAVPEIVIHCAISPHLVPRAIAHEMYHHREAIGEIERLCERQARETAADAFAAQLLDELA